MTAKKNGAGLGAAAPKPSEDSKNAPKGTATVASGDRAVSDRVAAAAALIAQGWAVLPLQGKAPLGALVPHGLKDATQDLAEVERWFAAHPRANLGAVPPVGCYVLDLDVYKNPGLESLGLRLAGLHTPMQRSGGGGQHFVIRGVPPSQTELRKVHGDGIDVKAHGKGYIVVAPSVHPDTGVIYEWGNPPDIKPADAPDWLFEAAPVPDHDDGDMLAPPKVQPLASPDAAPISGLTLDVARDALRHLPPSMLDEYGSWLRIGFALHAQFGEADEALALWDTCSRSSPKYEAGACAAKWATMRDDKVSNVTMRSVLQEARRHGWRAPATVARAVLDFAVQDWLADARADRFDLSKPPPPLDWLFQGTIRNAKLTVLAGAGGSSKSFFALVLAAHWAAGIPFDVFVPACRDPDDEALLLYAEEDELDLHHRFIATMRAAGFGAAQQQQIGHRLLLRSLFDLDRGMVLAEYEQRGRAMQRGPLFELLARTFETRPRLRWVLLDPLVLLHHLDENDNRSMAQMVGTLGALAMEHRVAIWLVHHLSKSGAQADDSTSQQVRGASAIVDNARGLLLLRRLTAQDASSVGATPQEARQMVRLSLPKHTHSGELPDRYFRIDEDTGAVHVLPVQPLAVPAQARRAVRQQAVKEQAAEFREATCQRALLELLDNKPLGSRAIYDAKPGGCSRSISERVLASAVEDGLVRVEEGRRGSRLHHLTSAGRERMAELGIPAEDLLK